MTATVDGDPFIRGTGTSLRSSFGSGTGDRLGCSGLGMGLDATIIKSEAAFVLFGLESA